MTLRLGCIAAMLSLAALSGCRLARYELTEPLDGRTMEVKSGDRVSVVLEEDTVNGYQWFTECLAPDVSFARETQEPSEDDVLNGRPGKVRIIIRFHRGFDGPANVRLMHARPWERDKPTRTIDMLFHKKAEDVAPWK